MQLTTTSKFLIVVISSLVFFTSIFLNRTLSLGSLSIISKALDSFRSPMMTFEKSEKLARVFTAMLPTTPQPPKTITFDV